MKKQQYRAIIYFIGVVVAITIATQGYWNYKNYQEGKTQLIRDVQVSFDKAVADYYESKAKQSTIAFFGNTPPSKAFFESDRIKALADRIDGKAQGVLSSIIISDDPESGFQAIEGASPKDIDSILKAHRNKALYTFPHDDQAIYEKSESGAELFFSQESDTITSKFSFPTKENFNEKAFEELTTKIVMSFSDDILDIEKLDSIITQELHRKKITGTNHKLSYTSPANDSTLQKTAFDLNVTSSSEFLPKNKALTLGFNNIARIVFKRNMLEILLSILLVIAVIGALLYLLKIIQEQKQLAEIKNDFISNITHEFKTPIATIGVAMESIQHFNKTNDPEKTKKYVDMSSQQVSKLNTMVEKLLETATLDSRALQLNKQETNLPELLEAIAHKYNSTQDKKIRFTSDSDQTWVAIDAFHMENALDNIVDNAIKYGGDVVDIAFAKAKNGIQIRISDNGNNLLKSQASQIFEKFYRVPKGNTHNVKGFGIGLYYTKTIIEKHNGSITVSTSPTTFKILLPYV